MQVRSKLGIYLEHREKGGKHKKPASQPVINIL
jgi:hypothetical protein